MSVDFNPSLVQPSGDSKSADKAGNAARSPEEQAKMREAAQKFEEMMLRQVFVQMQRSSSIDGGKGMATEFYGDMFAEKMAQTSSEQGGIGIADVLMRSWGVEPHAVDPETKSIEWSPQDLEEFSRYSSPIEGDIQLSASGRQLEIESAEGVVVAPRAGRLMVDGGESRIEHPGGWITRIQGAEVASESHGTWVEKGTEITRGQDLRATIESPLGSVV